MILLETSMEKLFKNAKNKIRKMKTFDWIIVGFAVLSISIFAYLFFRKSTYITVTVKVGEEEVFYSPWITSWTDLSGTKNWFADLFYKGQKEKDGLGKTKADVLEVFSYNKTPIKKTVYLKIKISTVYNRASNTFTYKGTPVLIGSQIKLNLNNISVKGLITEMEGFPEKKERQKILIEAQIREENFTYLETSGTKKYVADAIKKGEEIKDNNGNTIIKIIDKKVTPAKRVVTSANGEVFLRQDPLKKDVYLILEVETLKIGDQYFLLDDIPITIDQLIPINLPEISIFPIVTKFISD